MCLTDGSHVTTIRVRYAETDQMGLVYNAHYLTWFEVARTEFLRSLGLTYRETERRGFFLPLREAGVKYLKPAHYDDVLTIRTRLGARPGARIRLEYTVNRDTTIVATGFTEHPVTDTNLKPIKPPPELLATLRTCWQQAESEAREAPNDR